MTTRFLSASRSSRTVITALSFGLMLFGPIWTAIRFDDVFDRFVWMQRAFDEPHYFRQLYLQISEGALDINYRFFSKLAGRTAALDGRILRSDGHGLCGG